MLSFRFLAPALLAFALGVEMTCRLSKAISVPPAKGTVAWSQTGIAAGIGAAVGAFQQRGLVEGDGVAGEHDLAV